VSELPPVISALERSDEAIVVVDVQGVVVLMSNPAEALLGVSSDDVVGEFVEMLLPAKKRWGHQAYRRGYLAEPRDRDMDPGLEPIRVDGVLYVATHITPR
jgi:PAS domain S-box-containing protein